MKKSDYSASFLKKHLNLFICPHCRAVFKSADKGSLKCEGGHSYNISKKGSVHLLKGPGQSSYGSELFKARSRVNAWGMFSPIYKEIKILSRPYLSSGVVLDMGCGEGSLLEHLAPIYPDSYFIGLDNSKEAIDAAASKNWHGLYMTADLAQPPLRENAFDLLLNFFAPANYPMFKKLLKEDGGILKIIPGEKYLAELRKVLYADKSTKQHYDARQTKALFFKHYPKAEVKEVRYTLEISEEQKLDILSMSPLSWGAEDLRLEAAKTSLLKSITIDVNILCTVNH